MTPRAHLRAPNRSAPVRGNRRSRGRPIITGCGTLKSGCGVDRVDVAGLEYPALKRAVNASLALERYLLAGQIEVTLGLMIDSNPVTRSIRVQVVFPDKNSPEGRLLEHCVGFDDFGNFLLRWLAVRRGGVTQWLQELKPPEEQTP